jgi:hypothetical protein
MPYNGPAVEGVCVTSAAHPVAIPVNGEEIVTVGKLVWRGICHHGERGL